MTKLTFQTNMVNSKARVGVYFMFGYSRPAVLKNMLATLVASDTLMGVLVSVISVNSHTTDIHIYRKPYDTNGRQDKHKRRSGRCNETRSNWDMSFQRPYGAVDNTSAYRKMPSKRPGSSKP